MKISELLRQAKSLLDSPDKWCRIVATRAHAVCANTAIRRAAGASNVRSMNDKEAVLHEQACEVLAKAVNSPDISHFKRAAMRVISWNDASERTHVDILEGFDKAISLAEKREQGDEAGDGKMD